MGKACFAENYIQRCRSQWAETTKRTKFQQTISAAHTVWYNVQPSEFVNQRSLATTMNEILATTIKESLVPETVPELLAAPCPNQVRPFVKELAETLGPLFIVLDDFGMGFELEGCVDDRQSCEAFSKFCKYVLSGLVKVRGVFFVLTGQARFMHLLDSAPAMSKNLRSWHLLRLPLSVLHPDHIKEILTKTHVSETDASTLCERWGLEKDVKLLDKSASLLFDASSGCHASILTILQRYPRYSEFAKVGGQDAGVVDWFKLYRRMWLWRMVLRKWIPGITGSTPIDLSRTLVDEYHNPIWYGEVMDQCSLGWEGTLSEARVFAHPQVVDALINVTLPFRKFAAQVARLLPRQTMSRTVVFRCLCLKRLQWLFRERKVPCEVLPEFFGENMKFGMYTGGVQFSDQVDCLPGWKEDIWIDSIDWPKLMRLIDDELRERSISWKPRVGSMFLDAVMMMRNSGSDACNSRSDVEGHLLGKTTTLTVGLVARVEISKITVEMECRKLNDMFKHLALKYLHFGRLTNVLIVCATSYLDNWVDFKSGGAVSMDVPQDCDYVSEVLLLNLTTSQYRMRFFGLRKENSLWSIKLSRRKTMSNFIDA